MKKDLPTKHILITDPCYLISDKDWNKLCSQTDKTTQKDSTRWVDVFENLVQNHLRKISGDKKAVAGNTGFGDWENEIDGKYFTADSGMVCIVKKSRKLDKYIKQNEVTYNPLCVAELVVDEKATYWLDRRNPEWTEVVVEDWKKTYRSLTEVGEEDTLEGD